MAEYKLEVTTGGMQDAGTFDHIYVTLIGSEGVSERKELDNVGIDFIAGMTGTYTVKSNAPLGKVLLVKVEKDTYFLLEEDKWFCSKIVVTTPENDVILFPCNRWVSRGEYVELRGGKAMKVYEEEHSILIEHRKKELAFNKKLYKWGIFVAGLPHVNNFKTASDVPEDMVISQAKRGAMINAYIAAITEVRMKGLAGSTEQWESIEAMKNIFSSYKTPISEYVSDHWMEDDFYGFQFLNAVNSNVIQRCSKLPSNFPVTEEMVKPFLKDGSSLQQEMENGNIFICDYKRMDGISTRVENGEHLPLTPGLCLLYVNPEKKLMPIAIQLYQQPSEQNPIFLPSDPKPDWLLAKMFLRNADLIQHLGVFHHMDTHMLGEGFTMATLRNLPTIHPLYKLLIPHCRNNLYVNTTGRINLLTPEGPISKCSLGAEGLFKVMGRAFSETTYSSLCLPENIAARGLESIPNFYYRDDGLKLWAIINSFVKAILEYYYPSDDDVRKDSELQAWINDIFTHSFLSSKNSGIPASFQTVEEAIKFITMVIFRVTGQHATTNNGQFEYYQWLPNGTILLCKPPPTTKGKTTMKTILDVLPNVGVSASFSVGVWMLSKTYSDDVLMGTYPVELFDEAAPKKMIEEFQAKLSHLSEAITKRNSALVVPYNYLNPAHIENSVNK